MKSISFAKIFCFLAVILAGSILGFRRLSLAKAASTPGNKDSDAIKAISGYKEWKKANPEPQLMDSYLATLCTTPTPSRAKLDELDPHKDKWLTVYVNDTGYSEFTSKKVPHFAEGTVIVKEKLGDPTNTTPELLTVMIKRHSGFNPTDGDWEYLVFGGQASKVAARGKIQSCEECHETRQAEDYVFRSYLTLANSKALK